MSHDDPVALSRQAREVQVAADRLREVDATGETALALGYAEGLLRLRARYLQERAGLCR